MRSVTRSHVVYHRRLDNTFTPHFSEHYFIVEKIYWKTNKPPLELRFQVQTSQRMRFIEDHKSGAWTRWSFVLPMTCAPTSNTPPFFAWRPVFGPDFVKTPFYLIVPRIISPAETGGYVVRYRRWYYIVYTMRTRFCASETERIIHQSHLTGLLCLQRQHKSAVSSEITVQ